MCNKSIWIRRNGKRTLHLFIIVTNTDKCNSWMTSIWYIRRQINDGCWINTEKRRSPDHLGLSSCEPKQKVTRHWSHIRLIRGILISFPFDSRDHYNRADNILHIPWLLYMLRHIKVCFESLLSFLFKAKQNNDSVSSVIWTRQVSFS